MTATFRSKHLALFALLAALGVVPSACASANKQPRQADTGNELETDSSGDTGPTPPPPTTEAPEPVTPLGQLLYGSSKASASASASSKK
jgi:hypothetical protein